MCVISTITIIQYWFPITILSPELECTVIQVVNSLRPVQNPRPTEFEDRDAKADTQPCVKRVSAYERNAERILQMAVCEVFDEELLVLCSTGQRVPESK